MSGRAYVECDVDCAESLDVSVLAMMDTQFLKPVAFELLIVTTGALRRELHECLWGPFVLNEKWVVRRMSVCVPVCCHVHQLPGEDVPKFSCS